MVTRLVLMMITAFFIVNKSLSRKSQEPTSSKSHQPVAYLQEEDEGLETVLEWLYFDAEQAAADRFVPYVKIAP